MKSTTKVTIFIAIIITCTLIGVGVYYYKQAKLYQNSLESFSGIVSIPNTNFSDRDSSSQPCLQRPVLKSDDKYLLLVVEGLGTTDTDAYFSPHYDDLITIYGRSQPNPDICNDPSTSLCICNYDNIILVKEIIN